MKTLGRNSDNDIYLSADGGLAVVNGAEAQCTIIESILMTQKGELQFNEDGGIDYFGTVLKSPRNIEFWAATVRSKIEALDFVDSVEDFTYRFDRTQSTLFWSMTAINTDDERLDLRDRKLVLDGSPGVDVKWDDIYEKPSGTDEAIGTVSNMTAAAEPIYPEWEENINGKTLRDVKNAINQVLLTPNDPALEKEGYITFTFERVPLGTLIDISNLQIGCEEHQRGGLSYYRPFSMTVSDSKTPVSIPGGEWADVKFNGSSFTHTVLTRGTFTITFKGEITGIKSRDCEKPIFLNSKGKPFQYLTKFYVGSQVPLSTIGDGSFRGFDALNIQQNKSAANGWMNNSAVESIAFGEYAFAGCQSLLTLNWLPSALTSIGEGCFDGCSMLPSLSGLPQGLSVTTLPDRCFAGCSSLESLSGLPETITALGDEAFSGCSSLRNLKGLPDGITSLGQGCFSGCSGLEAILYPPEELTEIGNSCFERCASLRSVYLPKKLETIGYSAFANCTSLDNVFVDSDKTPTVDIGAGAFAGSAESLTIFVAKNQLAAYQAEEWGGITAKNIKNYGVFTFELKDSVDVLHMVSSTSYLLSDSIWTIDLANSTKRYRYEKSTTNLPETDLEINGTSIDIRGYIREMSAASENAYPFLASDTSKTFDKLERVMFSDTPIEFIGDYCFAGCSSLSFFDLSSGAGEVWQDHPYRLGAYTFLGCKDLTSIDWLQAGLGLLKENSDDNAPFFDAFGEGCFKDSGLTQLNYPKDATLATVRVTYLPAYCFSGTDITSLSGIGGAEMESVGAHCFDGCTSLTTIEDLAGTGIEYLPDYCFANCSSLTSIAGIEKIRSTLVTQTDEDGDGTYTVQRETVLGKHLFENCTSLTSIEPLASAYTTPPPDIASYSQYYSYGIEDLSDYMFAGCSALVSLTGITDRIHSLGVSCFEGCSGLAYRWNGDEVVPETYPLMPISESQIREIPAYCFAGCTELANLIGLDNIVTYGDSCFKGCTGLACNSGMGDNTSSIGQEAFSGCTSLRYVTMLAVTPPSVDRTAFTDVATSTIPLYVREDSIDSYKANAVWNSFQMVTSRTIKLNASGVSEITSEMASSSVLTAATHWRENKMVPGLYFVEYGDGSRYSFLGDRQSLLSPHVYAQRGNYTITIYGDILEVSAPLQSSNTHFVPQDGDGVVSFLGALSANVTSIEINSPYLEEIGDFCFKGYSNLNTLSVQMASGGNVGAFVFADCGILRTVSQFNAETIGDCAFLRCLRLEKLTAFNSVLTVGDFCFAGDVLLKSLEGLSIVRNVGSHAFSGCVSLSSTEGMDVVSNIGPYAFASYDDNAGTVFPACTALKTVSGFGDALTVIGDCAFSGCPIESIFIAASIPPYIYERTFDTQVVSAVDLYVPFAAVEVYKTQYPSITGTVWDGNTENYWAKFGERIKSRSLSFTLSGIKANDVLTGNIGVVEADGAWSISYGDGEQTFSYTGTVALPEYCFQSGSAFDERVIRLSGSIKGLRLENAQVYPFFNLEQDGLFPYLKKIESTSLVPIESIGVNTFRGCTGLTAAENMQSVTALGDSCFMGCTSLADISGFTAVKTIGNSCFSGCRSLANLDGLHSVETIGAAAFSGCNGLEYIDGLGMNVASIGANAFLNCNNLKEVQILAVTPPQIESSSFSKKDIPLYVLERSRTAYQGWGGFSNVASRNITFFLNDVAQYATIADGCGTLDSDTYWVIDYGISDTNGPQMSGFDKGEDKEFPSYQFAITGGDITLRIEGAITSIRGKYIEGETREAAPASKPFLCFEEDTEGMNRLTSISTSADTKLDEVGDCAFFNCTSLCDVSENSTIPADINLPTVTKIGAHAFEGCTHIKELIGFSAVHEMGDYAFYGCTGLTRLAGLSASLSGGSIGAKAFGGGIWIEYIQISAQLPPTLDETAFEGSYGGVYDSTMSEEEMEEKLIVLLDRAGTPSKYFKNSVYAYVPAASIGNYERTVAWAYLGEDDSSAASGFKHFISSRSMYITLSLPAKSTITFNGNVTYAPNITANGSWSIDWGDGSTPDLMSEAVTTIPPHTYVTPEGNAPVTYVVTIEGDIRSIAGEGTDSIVSYYQPMIKVDNAEGNPYIKSVQATDALNITTIGKYAFAGCTALEKVAGFTNAQYVGFGAFYGCTNLAQLGQFPALSFIDAYGFAECGRISTLSCFPAIDRLGDYAFYNDSSLLSIAGLGEAVGETAIATFGSSVFEGCSLQSIDSEYKTPPSITVTTFAGTSYTETPVFVPVGCVSTYQEAPVWELYKDNTYESGFAEFTFRIQRNDIISGTGLNFSGNYMISWGDGNTETTGDTVISHTYESVPSSGVVTVRLRGDLQSIIPTDDTNPVFGVRRFTETLKTCLTGVLFRNVSHFSEIGHNAFMGCTNLNTVRIAQSNSFNTLGENAFNGCSSLSTICLDSQESPVYGECLLPASLTSVGPHAFEGCSSIQSVKWEPVISAFDSTNDGGAYMFAGCTNLETVQRFGGLTTIPHHCFFRCRKLKNITDEANELHTWRVLGNEGVTELGDYCFAKCDTIGVVNIPQSVNVIGIGCFSCIPQLSSNDSSFDYDTMVANPAAMASTDPVGMTAFRWDSSNPLNVYTLGMAAFAGCNRMTVSGNFPELLSAKEETETHTQSVPSFAFFNCRNIRDFRFLNPNSTSEILGYAFAYSGISDLNNARYQSNGVMNEGLFMGCDSLNSLTGIPTNITTLGDYCFAECSNLLSISNQTVVTIGKYCFWNCGKAVSVELPSCETFGDYCFAGCSLLQPTTLPACKSLGGNAFGNCTSLTSVNLPNCTSIGQSCFSGCTGMTSLELFPKVESYPTNAFSGCSSLTTVSGNAASGLASLTFDTNAFADCSAITTINLPYAFKANANGDPFSGLNSDAKKSACRLNVSGVAFNQYWDDAYWSKFNINGLYGKTKIMTLLMKIPRTDNGVLTTDSRRTYTCTGNITKTISPSDSTYSIIWGDNTETSISLNVPVGTEVSHTYPMPEDDTNNAVTITVFSNDVVTVAGKIGSIKSAFGGNGGLYQCSPFIYCSTASKSDYYSNDSSHYVSVVASGSDWNPDIREVQILTDIHLGAAVLSNLHYLNKVVGIEHIQGEIGNSAFMNSLADKGNQSNFDNNPIFKTADPSLNNVFVNVLSVDMCAFACSPIWDLIFFHGVKIEAFKYEAFAGCFNLNDISDLEPPDDDAKSKRVFSQGDRPYKHFMFCSSLSDIGGMANYAITSLPQSMFLNCSSLASLEGLPISLKTIEQGAFQGCSLTDLSALPPYITDIGASVFRNNKIGTLDNWPVGCRVIKKSCFEGNSALTNLNDMPDSVDTIGESAFKDCSGLETISYKQLNIRTIGPTCFQGCTALTKLTYTDSITGTEKPCFANVTSIGKSCFGGCSSLTSLNGFPQGITSIPEGCFGPYNRGNVTYGCIAITSLLGLPSGLDSIGASAFKGCTGLTDISDLPSSVQSLGAECFSGCISLSSIDELPQALTMIGARCFAGCTSLTDISSLARLTNISELPESCFNGCTSLMYIGTKTGENDIIVGLPSNLTTIGAGCFGGCNLIKVIVAGRYFASYTPPITEIDDDGKTAAFAYDGLNNNPDFMVYVPTDGLSAYSAANGWLNFADSSKISGYTPSA